MREQCQYCVGVRRPGKWVMEKMAYEKVTWQAWKNFPH